MPNIIVMLMILLMVGIVVCFAWENKRNPTDKVCTKCKNKCNYLTEGDICQDCADDEKGEGCEM